MAHAQSMIEFIDASPTPFHAVANSAARLEADGFEALDPTADWNELPHRGFVADGGALFAWSGPCDPAEGFRLIAAHTDSPNLRVAPRPDVVSEGFCQLAIEPYGGLLANSWLDRDLGIAGRVFVAEPGARSASSRLFRSATAMARIPQLAIHLDRDIVSGGLVLDRDRHLTPVWGLADSGPGSWAAWLAGCVECEVTDLVGFDAMFFDTASSAILGPEHDLIAAPRLDNLCSCFGAIESLLRAAVDDSHGTAIVALFDHEEVGSVSKAGAAGGGLASLLRRLTATMGHSEPDHARALANSACLSADMAHATHPNYPERHDRNHHIRAGGGPVIKTNVNQRYATDGSAASRFRLAARGAGVAVQEYSHRNDLPCGSTIGPLTAAGLGVDVVDVGAPQLSMHSIREMMAVADVDPMIAVFDAWYRT
jgi:aspartyl aminopeptidase